MAKVLGFPQTEDTCKRLARRDIAILDGEIAAIQAKIDRDIVAKHGSIEGYGRFILEGRTL